MVGSWLTGAPWLAAPWLETVAAAEPPSGKNGEQIYRRLCVSCHGPAGEGVADKYAQPLTGDKPLVELIELIDRTMPENDPKLCVGDDARQVAEYVYHAFYSPIAQARNAPPRIELSRLTVRQFRQSIADLIGSFRGTTTWKDPGTLKTEFFKSKRFVGNERLHTRFDAQIDYDFGDAAPQLDGVRPEDLTAAEFAIRWMGAIYAPETGNYEFIVDSTNATRLWVNDFRQPLVDGLVRSGTDTIQRESIWLLGGRIYPLKFEFFKSKEAKDKTARVALRWRLPHRQEAPLSGPCIAPVDPSGTLLVGTKFPADDRSVGYERGTSVSRAWDEATTEAALEVADYVLANINDLARVKPAQPDRAQRIQQFCEMFAERAFRRPLTAELKQQYVASHFHDDTPLEVSVKRVVLMTLKSPRFLYPELEHAQPDPYDVAARLSYGLWDSLPDAALLNAAKAKQLGKPEQIRQQATRMLNDPRTRGKLHEFFTQWLRIDRFQDLAKDSQRFPEFDEALVSDLRTALEMFLDEVAWGESSDFRQLLVTDSLYLNGRLAKYYGADLPADAPFQRVELQPRARAGVLTHPYLMAGYAYTSNSSPIHRGVFLARSVLGRALRAPPDAVAPTPPDLQPDLTTRERVALQTQGTACQSCHRMINPLGFAFEHFDAVGRFRDQERGKPIDATGSYLARDGKSVKFRDVGELAEFLARSPETHEAFAQQLFNYLVKQPIQAYGPTALDELRTSFEKQQFSIRQLMVEIMVRSALVPRAPAVVAQNP